MTQVHIDVFLRCLGKTFPVGHGDVEHTDDLVEQAGHVATLLHELAWEYEELAKRQAAGEFEGRIAINKAGDRFYEVKADEFVVGMSHSDAVETYYNFGGASPLDHLSQAYPDLHIMYPDNDE